MTDVVSVEEVIGVVVAVGVIFEGFGTVVVGAVVVIVVVGAVIVCLLYTSPSPRDQRGSRMPSSA